MKYLTNTLLVWKDRMFDSLSKGDLIYFVPDSDYVHIQGSLYFSLNTTVAGDVNYVDDRKDHQRITVAITIMENENGTMYKNMPVRNDQIKSVIFRENRPIIFRK
jgi:hypothetical protein